MVIIVTLTITFVITYNPNDHTIYTTNRKHAFSCKCQWQLKHPWLQAFQKHNHGGYIQQSISINMGQYIDLLDLSYEIY
jgi:hypothetical protein